MKSFMYVSMLLGSLPVLAGEQAKLEAICDKAFIAYNTQNVNLIAPYLQAQIPQSWSAEKQAKALERGLSDVAKKFERRRASFGDIRYELTGVKLYEKAEIPQLYQKLDAERYIVLSYMSHSVDNPTGRLGASCAFFDYDGEGDWQIRTILW